jgi:predicted permease
MKKAIPMRWLDKLRLRLRSVLRHDVVDHELDDELRFHVERQIAESMAAGMSPGEARYAALREFGGVEQIREECADMRDVNWLQDLAQDIRYGLRMLRKSPGFTAVAVLTLALGIGANTAIFSFVDAALLRAVPVTDPESLMLLEWSAHAQPKHLNWDSYGDCVSQSTPTLSSSCSISEPMFHDIRDKTNVFSSMAAFASGDRLDVSGNGDASTVDNPAYISGDYFQTLGIRPFIGRLIGAADDAPTASPVVVLSYAYWKTNFSSSPSAIGRTILLNKVPFAIIGVAEPRFDALSPGNLIQIWLPLSSVPRIELPWDNRDADFNYWWLSVIGRLKPGTSRAQAQAAVGTLFRNEVLHSAKPAFQPKDDATLSLIPAQQGLVGDTTELAAPLYVLMLAVGVVLLIACANVAGLLLSRATRRLKEIALRFALGARRGRVVRQFLTESLLLSLAGGALGLLFARWACAAIAAFVGSNIDYGASSFNPALDSRVLGFTAAVSLLTGVLFGLAPALRGIRVDLTPALKEGAGGSNPATHRSGRWFTAANMLVVAQVALTVIVLAAAGLLVRTLENLKSVNPGFDTRNILTFRVDPTLIGYKRTEMDSFYQDLQNRLAAIPGVRSVSYSLRPLLGNGLWTTSFGLPGHPKDETFEADMLPVGSGFFETMRIPLRLGRQFDSTDFAEAAHVGEILEEENERVAAGVGGSPSAIVAQNKNAAADLPPTPAIVNDAFVKKYFPNTNPLGIHFGDRSATEDDPTSTPGWEIRGVVADAKYNELRREVHPTIYVPASGRAVAFTLRTAIDPANFVPQIRSIVGQMDRNLPIYRIRTETQQIDSQLFMERLVARLSSFFGLLALVLACLGLYGLLSYEVTRRTREIGIRMALGAKAGNVLRLVIGQGIALAALGAVIGIGAALGIMRFLASLLYNVRAADPLTFVGVAVLLGAVATLACYLPAHRATRVDPLVALRYE